MLTVQMPDSEDDKEKRQKQRWMALGYLIAGAVIMTTLFVAYDTQLWYLPVGLEAWWLWSIINQDWDRSVHK